MVVKQFFVCMKTSSLASRFILSVIVLFIWYTYLFNIIIGNNYEKTIIHQEEQQQQLPPCHDDVVVDCECSSSKRNSKKEVQSSRVTINHTKMNNNGTSSNMRIDLISVGSLYRSEYMITQKESWGSHSSIRSFWGLTELDDDNPSCSVGLDMEDYMNQCKNKSINVWDSSTSTSSTSSMSVSSLFRSKHYGMDTMKKKNIKSGWICAQKRPGFAIGRIGRLYKENIIKQQQIKSEGATDVDVDAVLPDYLIIMDDDTYINMKKFIPYLLTKNKEQETKSARIYAGCLRADPTVFEKHNMHWIYPWGGFGLILNRASIERLIMPIHCNSDSSETNFNSITTSPSSEYQKFVCSRVKQNLIGEESLFENGMSISDLAYKISSRKYFCMHSDHLTSYLVHYYQLSDFGDDPKSSRIHEYDNNANCAFDGVKKCNTKSSHICHRIDAETMKTYYYSNNAAAGK